MAETPSDEPPRSTPEESDPLTPAHESDSRPGPPPLRIHHILVATVVTAVLLSAHEGQKEFTVRTQYLRSVAGMVQTISTGLAVTAVLFGLWWRREGRAVFNQPGHWLLVYRALWIGGEVFIAMTVALRLMDDGESYVKIEEWSVAIFILSIAITQWSGFRVADTRLWKTFFLLTCSWWLAMWLLRWLGANALIMVVSTAGVLATTLVLFAAAVADRRAGRERDWAHWLGVALEVSVIGTWLAQSVWSWVVG